MSILCVKLFCDLLTFGWTRYKIKINQSIKFKKFCCPMCFIVSVISFNVYFFGGKRKKHKSLNFSKSNAHRKTNVRNSFETNTFLFSLIISLIPRVFKWWPMGQSGTSTLHVWPVVSFKLYREMVLWSPWTSVFLALHSTRNVIEDPSPSPFRKR